MTTRSPGIWHDRPVVAPIIYGLSTFIVSALGYEFGYLLLRHIKNGVYCSLFMSALNVLYLVECRRTARRGTGNEAE